MQRGAARPGQVPGGLKKRAGGGGAGGRQPPGNRVGRVGGHGECRYRRLVRRRSAGGLTPLSVSEPGGWLVSGPAGLEQDKTTGGKKIGPGPLLSPAAVVFAGL